MGKAARAIIIEDTQILVMRRQKEGQEYFTLVGGRVSDGESLEQGLVREVKEETGLDITAARLVYVEEHPEPYNEQYIYLCHVAPHGPVTLPEHSEEAMLNRIETNIHEPLWVDAAAFARLPFRTPQLQVAISQALATGFPTQAVKL